MNKDEFTKEDYILLAKLAQQTQRYDDMVDYVDKLFLPENQLTNPQRNLCSSAYKNVIGNLRAQIKVLDSLQQKAKDSPTMSDSIQDYKQKIIDQLQKYCNRIIKIIDQQILPSKCQIKSVQSKVFYLKLKGDYYRYLCEWSSNNSDRYTARACYEEADNLARSNLPQTNPVRLSLHLNMSVFLYEQENETQKALQLANRAFQEAIANIDTVNEENYKDCTMILQLIRDNISLWDDSEQ